ncbi:hypothetical protein J5N97_016378 [Dioscorea zingiberensis]|uniref:Uncharacterized protein n=1 Tax=Dioscorea zingiberensis TaxID=325984 RepID=A0A9D5CJ81_9LILI|nr:hypothetical protein J5N97_016378 [Dioscorea zingiberensis]
MQIEDLMPQFRSAAELFGHTEEQENNEEDQHKHGRWSEFAGEDDYRAPSNAISISLEQRQRPLSWDPDPAKSGETAEKGDAGEGRKKAQRAGRREQSTGLGPGTGTDD